MNQQIMQDIQQIRSIAQQLEQNERQNARSFSQSSGYGQNSYGPQNFAQRETNAAQQLQQILQLASRVEQSVQTQSYGHTAAYHNGLSQGSNSYGNSYNSAAFNSVMQADRQPYTNEGYGYYNTQGQGQGSQFGFSNSTYGNAGGSQYNQGAVNQVLQADRQPYTNEGSSQAGQYGSYGSYGYGGGQATSNTAGSGSINQVMQADHRWNTSDEPSLRNYNSGAAQNVGSSYASQRQANGQSAYQGSVNQGAFSQVMQADRQSYTNEGQNYQQFR